MCTDITSKIIHTTRSAALLFAAFVLVTLPRFTFGQSSPSDVCHMDSSGFCISGEVHNPPSWISNQHSTPSPEVPAVPQGNASVAPTSAGQPKFEVEYHNGLLRVVAEHISMRDVLTAISGRTGAEVQFPAGALSEHVFVHLGPAPPQEVVAQLLGIPVQLRDPFIKLGARWNRTPDSHTKSEHCS